jgi:Domain of unknown function (DUF4833)
MDFKSKKNIKHMNYTLKIALIILTILLYFDANIIAQAPNYPVPKDIENQLFFLQRTKNTNTIIYEVNEKEGILNKENPINYYWIMYNEKGQKQPLSKKERAKAYGLKISNIENEKCDLKFVALKPLNMSLEKGVDKQFHVFTKINNKNAMLKRIFFEFKGAFWSPKIKSIYLEGIDLDTNLKVNEKRNF